MRLVTWNVAGRVTRQPEQAAVIAAVGADVVALQEVTARTLPLWRDELAEAGFGSCETALDGIGPVAGRRLLGALTAAREPLERLPAPADVPWPERVLCCLVGDVEVVNLHSPISPAPDLAKVRTHEALFAYLAEPGRGPRALCGDLNTPRRELPDGEVLTFAHDSAGRLRAERGERWNAAERALVRSLRDHGWVDAFRALHGYGERHASWTFARNRGGWRLDHVLVQGLRPVASAYAHDWRIAGLSDHSALIVDLARGLSSPAPGKRGAMANPVPAGSDASAGTYRCTQCGYDLDVASTQHLPPCPSCGNGQWDTVSGGDSVHDPYPDRA